MKLGGSLLVVTLAMNTTFSFANQTGLETVVVIGKQNQMPDSDLVGSIDILTNDELTYEHVDDTLEIFNKIPGVYLSRFNQGIINTNVAIRGFAGDGPTPHAKLLIDGIPSNLNTGLPELDQLFPIGIASVSAFKGTSDPRYGLFNIAGNYNVNTRQDDARELEVTLGSFNTRQVQGYFGSTRGKLKQNYAIGHRTSEGYRDRTDLEKYTLSGSWQWDISSANQLRVTARHASYDGDAPGYFDDESAAQRNPTASTSFADQDGGDKETNHLSAHWNQSLSERVEWSLKAYWQTFERQRWVRFSQSGPLTNRYGDQEQTGLISTLSWSFADEWSLDWGADYEFQDVVEQRFSTVNNTRQRDAVTRDRIYDSINYGTYVQLLHEPNEKLRWNVALRADQLRGDFKDQLSSPENRDRDMFDFGTIIQPKFNIVYSFSEQLNVFANAGRSFQHPFGAAAYTNGDRNARDVSFNDGWELGTQWQIAKSTIRLSWWQQKAKDEFILLDGTEQNVGETTRDGIDVAFNGEISDSLSYWGNYTVVNSEIQQGSNKGNELRSIPDFTASLGVNYQVTARLIARLHLDAQGDYYVNEANAAGQFGDYTILSFSGDYDAGWGIIKLQLNNLTDEYFAYVFDFSNDGTGPIIHSPGDGLNGSLSVKLPF